VVVQGQAFKGRQFTAEVILWAVRWYLMFPISYRDIECMLQDRGVLVDHTTIFRWIQAYAARAGEAHPAALVRKSADGRGSAAMAAVQAMR
jgi:transposase-like protein